MQMGHHAVGILILERVTPIWGVPAEIHSDRRTHFTGQTVKEICKIWQIMQHFHCAYHPRSFGLVENTNGTIKIQLAKIVDAYSLPWPKALVGSPQPKVYSLWEASFVSL